MKSITDNSIERVVTNGRRFFVRTNKLRIEHAVLLRTDAKWTAQHPSFLPAGVFRLPESKSTAYKTTFAAFNCWKEEVALLSGWTKEFLWKKSDETLLPVSCYLHIHSVLFCIIVYMVIYFVSLYLILILCILIFMFRFSLLLCMFRSRYCVSLCCSV